MEPHEPDRPSEVIAKAYLDALDVFAHPPPTSRPLPPPGVLHGELIAVMRSLRPIMGELSASLEALNSGAPSELATSVAAEATVNIHLAWLRLVHHAEVILANEDDPASRRVALLARALAPAARTTAERASHALALQPST